jgi:hypothetical protein
MKHPVIMNSSIEPTRKTNMVSGSSYFVTKINLFHKLTKYRPTGTNMLEIMATDFKGD